MATPTPCTPCCTTPSIVDIPGTDGLPGADGAAGAAGPNSVSDATTTTFADGILAAKTGLLEILPNSPPAAVDDSAITNATVGAVDTLAVATGVGMSALICRHDWTVGGTAAVEPITNYTVGYKFRIVSWAWITSVLMTGAGGSRVANLAINGVPVGTVTSTVTVAIASAAVGSVIASTAVSGANTGSATATLSVQIAATGTALTAGSGIFVILIQNMDTADAVASLAKHVNDLITALTP